MRRVTRHACEDAPIPEEQETEGQRQLHSLLLQQLDTEADINRCVAKRKCFAPAALYKPFGEQAAGVRSLSQFQALQDGEQELASLRELGLTDAEIELWRRRDMPEAGEKWPIIPSIYFDSPSPTNSLPVVNGQANSQRAEISTSSETELTHPLSGDTLSCFTNRGVCAAPGARSQRMKVIQDKIEAREKLLSQPQRLSASRPLSRREMEIERALFHGSDRLNFLSALYHQEEDSQSGREPSSSSDPLDLLYRDILKDERQVATLFSAESEGRSPECTPVSQPKPKMDCGQTHSLNGNSDHRPADSQIQSNNGTSPLNCLSKDFLEAQNTIGHAQPQVKGGGARLAGQSKIYTSQPIKSLCGVARPGTGGPLTISGPVELIPEEEILGNRETEAGIRRIPRFQNYQPGEPSKVLCIKNLSTQASLAQLVSLFSRFQQPEGPPLLYRLLTGRLKGQAFITFSDTEMAEAALELVNGYRLLDKPLVIEFGRERRTGEKERGSNPAHSGHSTETTRPAQEERQSEDQS